MPTAPLPDDVLRAAAQAYAGMPITLGELTRDGTRLFSYKEGALTVTGEARLSGQTVQLTRLEVRPTDPAAALTAAQVKGLPFGRVVSSLQTLLALNEGRLPAGPATRPEKPESPRRGGRPAITDDLLRQLAEAYLEETAEGAPSGPLTRVAARFDRPTETIRTWLARARKEGWLAPAVKGRAGGEPGPRLLVYRMAQASGVAAPEVGLHIPDDETDAEKEAREQRLHDFAEDAGKLWEQIRSSDSE
ncbi:hypothetical protein ACWEBX_03445 [Streptomyces sp. NPDC005070]